MSMAGVEAYVEWLFGYLDPPAGPAIPVWDAADPLGKTPKLLPGRTVSTFESGVPYRSVDYGNRILQHVLKTVDQMGYGLGQGLDVETLWADGVTQARLGQLDGLLASSEDLFLQSPEMVERQLRSGSTPFLDSTRVPGQYKTRLELWEEVVGRARQLEGPTLLPEAEHIRYRLERLRTQLGAEIRGAHRAVIDYGVEMTPAEVWSQVYEEAKWSVENSLRNGIEVVEYGYGRAGMPGRDWVPSIQSYEGAQPSLEQLGGPPGGGRYSRDLIQETWNHRVDTHVVERAKMANTRMGIVNRLELYPATMPLPEGQRIPIKPPSHWWPEGPEETASQKEFKFRELTEPPPSEVPTKRVVGNRITPREMMHELGQTTLRPHSEWTTQSFFEDLPLRESVQAPSATEARLNEVADLARAEAEAAGVPDPKGPRELSPKYMDEYVMRTANEIAGEVVEVREFVNGLDLEDPARKLISAEIKVKTYQEFTTFAESAAASAMGDEGRLLSERRAGGRAVETVFEPGASMADVATGSFDPGSGTSRGIIRGTYEPPLSMSAAANWPPPEGAQLKIPGTAADRWYTPPETIGELKPAETLARQVGKAEGGAVGRVIGPGAVEQQLPFSEGGKVPIVAEPPDIPVGEGGLDDLAAKLEAEFEKRAGIRDAEAAARGEAGTTGDAYAEAALKRHQASVAAAETEWFTGDPSNAKSVGVGPDAKKAAEKAGLKPYSNSKRLERLQSLTGMPREHIVSGEKSLTSRVMTEVEAQSSMERSIAELQGRVESYYPGELGGETGTAKRVRPLAAGEAGTTIDYSRMGLSPNAQIRAFSDVEGRFENALNKVQQERGVAKGGSIGGTAGHTDVWGQLQTDKIWDAQKFGAFHGKTQAEIEMILRDWTHQVHPTGKGSVLKPIYEFPNAGKGLARIPMGEGSRVLGGSAMEARGRIIGWEPGDTLVRLQGGTYTGGGKWSNHSAPTLAELFPELTTEGPIRSTGAPPVGGGGPGGGQPEIRPLGTDPYEFRKPLSSGVPIEVLEPPVGAQIQVPGTTRPGEPRWEMPRQPVGELPPGETLARQVGQQQRPGRTVGGIHVTPETGAPRPIGQVAGPGAVQQELPFRRGGSAIPIGERGPWRPQGRQVPFGGGPPGPVPPRVPGQAMEPYRGGLPVPAGAGGGQPPATTRRIPAAGGFEPRGLPPGGGGQGGPARAPGGAIPLGPGAPAAAKASQAYEMGHGPMPQYGSAQYGTEVPNPAAATRNTNWFGSMRNEGFRNKFLSPTARYAEAAEGARAKGAAAATRAEGLTGFARSKALGAEGRLVGTKSVVKGGFHGYVGAPLMWGMAQHLFEPAIQGGLGYDPGGAADLGVEGAFIGAAIGAPFGMMGSIVGAPAGAVVNIISGGKFAEVLRSLPAGEIFFGYGNPEGGASREKMLEFYTLMSQNTGSVEPGIAERAADIAMSLIEMQGTGSQPMNVDIVMLAGRYAGYTGFPWEPETAEPVYSASDINAITTNINANLAPQRMMLDVVGKLDFSHVTNPDTRARLEAWVANSVQQLEVGLATAAAAPATTAITANAGLMANQELANQAAFAGAPPMSMGMGSPENFDMYLSALGNT